VFFPRISEGWTSFHAGFSARSILVVAASLLTAASIIQTGCGGASSALPPALATMPQASQPQLTERNLTGNSITYRNVILADTPLAYYHLDETSGSTVADSSGYKRTGTISGHPTYSVIGALSGDSAMGFNGTDSWITAPIPMVGRGYSLEAWVKTTSSQGFVVDISPQQLIFEAGRFKFGTGSAYLWSSSSTYGDGRYHHVVATYDGTWKRLYVDGSQANSTVDSGASISGSTTYIARYYNGGYVFSGSLDEVAIYGKALTAAQVLAHYNAGIGSSATPTPSPSAGISTKHVLTADYAGAGVGTTAAAALLGPWLNWASTSWQANTALRAVGIKVMYYTNPNREAPGDAMYTSDETTFAHDCSGKRILTTTYGQYLMDPSKSSLRNVWNDYIQSKTAGVTWDAMFEDDANDVYGAPTMPCGYSASSWLSSSQGENAFQSPVPIIYNGLQIAGQIGLNSSPNVAGGMEEGCYSLNPTLKKAFDSYWTQREDTEITMAQENKLFFCYGMDTNSASSSVDSRIYSYASFLMTYKLSSSVLWEYYATSSGLHVMPESKLVALDPLITTPSTIGGLLLSTGVYGREYAHCYLAGSYVGPCATVVNSSRYTAHAYPYGSKYKHTLTLSGSGVLEGGSVSVTGSAPPSTLGNLEAVIVFN